MKINEGPTWAKSPQMTPEKDIKNEHTKPTEDIKTPIKECNIQVDSTEPAISIDVIGDLITPRSEGGPSSILTVDSSLLESVSLPTMKEKPRGPISNKNQIEAAVSALAKQQKQEIQKLMEQQAKEREQLRQLFENQQRELLHSVLSAVSQTQTEDTGVMADIGMCESQGDWNF